MSIQVGDQIPDVSLTVITADSPQKVASSEFFAGKTVVLFALPGAFTPTCSARHLPGYKDLASEFKAKGVDQIACLSVNDAFVMKAWGKDVGVSDEVTLLADGSAFFTQSVGLELDLVAAGMGVRSQRYAMVVKDGKVAALYVEAAGEFKVSAADYVLERL